MLGRKSHQSHPDARVKKLHVKIDRKNSWRRKKNNIKNRNFHPIIRAELDPTLLTKNRFWGEKGARLR